MTLKTYISEMAVKTVNCRLAHNELLKSVSPTTWTFSVTNMCPKAYIRMSIKRTIQRYKG